MHVGLCHNRNGNVRVRPHPHMVFVWSISAMFEGMLDYQVRNVSSKPTLVRGHVCVCISWRSGGVFDDILQRDGSESIYTYHAARPSMVVAVSKSVERPLAARPPFKFRCVYTRSAADVLHHLKIEHLPNTCRNILIANMNTAQKQQTSHRRTRPAVRDASFIRGAIVATRQFRRWRRPRRGLPRGRGAIRTDNCLYHFNDTMTVSAAQIYP